MSTGTREEITIGQLAVRPRVEPEESDGSVAIHEFDVPAGAGLPLPHSHDAYEETIYGLAGTVTFTIEGTPTEIGPGEAVCIPAAPCTPSRTAARSTRPRSRSSPPASSARTTSARWRRSSTQRPAAHPISPRSAR